MIHPTPNPPSLVAGSEHAAETGTNLHFPKPCLSSELEIKVRVSTEQHENKCLRVYSRPSPEGQFTSEDGFPGSHPSLPRLQGFLLLV